MSIMNVLKKYSLNKSKKINKIHIIIKKYLFIKLITIFFKKLLI